MGRPYYHDNFIPNWAQRHEGYNLQKLYASYPWKNHNSNITSFFRFVKKWAIYRLGIISLAHVPVHLTDFPIVNVHVDELSSARIWQHKLCATLSANVNINYRLPIKVYYRISTLRHIRIEMIHGSQNVFCVLTWLGRILVNFIPLISANPC